MNRLERGLTGDGGASHFLATRLPYPLAYELLASGQPIGAPRLHALGLVNALAAHERDNFVAALFHDDGGEGIEAFLARRPPRFERDAGGR